MSLKDELLTPFRGAGEAGRGLADGSRVLAGYAWRGLRLGIRSGWKAATKGDSTSDRADSLGGALLAGLVVLAVAATVGGALLYVVRPYLRWAAAGLVVLWVVAAWAVAPPREPDTTPNDHEMLVGEQHPQPDPHHAARAVIRHTIAAVADAGRDGYKGIHLAELLDQLRADELTQLDDVGQLRTWLEEAGIPCNRNLKRDGKGPTWGVRWDELVPALGMSLTDALAVLDQAPAGEVTEAPVPARQETPAAPLAGAGQQAAPGRHLSPVPDPSPEAAA